jgi:hypothetical protein
MINIRFRCQRELNAEPGSHAVLALESTAQSLNSFPHPAQAVPFDCAAAAPIILDFDPAIPI